MKQLIWDLPTRLFHWGFAVSIVLAYALVQVSHEGTVAFYSHIVLGLIAGLLMGWRAVWAIMGSKHARFPSLLFRPGDVKDYFLSIVRGRGKYYAGHNPGSALAIWAMYLLSVATIASGLALGRAGESFKEVHEIAPNLLLAVAGLHILGVALATIMHKENYLVSMFSGRKTGNPDEAILHAHPLAALCLVVWIAAGACYLISGFDFAKGTFHAPGTNVNFQFGEGES